MINYTACAKLHDAEMSPNVGNLINICAEDVTHCYAYNIFSDHIHRPYTLYSMWARYCSLSNWLSISALQSPRPGGPATGPGRVTSRVAFYGELGEREP